MSKETQVLSEPETHSYRLPRSVVPERYEIRLEPDLNKFIFIADETVHVIVAEPVKEILLNALDLEIEEARIENGRGDSQVAKIAIDRENERARLQFAATVESGLWRLYLRFRGKINERLHGIYRSIYKDASGINKAMATTHFQATDARRAFPCWDEPDFKAVFKVSLIVDAHLTAISNASIESDKPLPERGKKEVVFNDTIKMSTYLVAFIAGELAGTKPLHVGGEANDGTAIRLWAPPGNGHLTGFGEDIASFSLSLFNRYYGFKFPIDKLDLIVIPDFAYGGMENFAAITFRDTALLVDEKTSTHAERERVADVVAHEIAHMWFGDLTTMAWWNGIWLNEAFATFMAMLAVDAWKPEWKRWESFAALRAEAFSTDSLRTTRTIEFPVRRPEEAQAMFDVLTYKKGAAVLRMLEQYLSPEVFRAGIALYLAKHKYGNTETSDLWDAIEESSGQPVRVMMDSWIYQEGHPLISAHLDEQGTTLTLTQKRFLYVEYALKKTADNTLFHVPIILKAQTAAGMTTEKVLLTESSTKIKFDQKVDFVVVNAGGHGFYRVLYDKPLLAKLTSKLDELDSVERFNLVNDTWASVLAGLQSLSDYLAFIRLFRDESDKNVWSVIISSFQYLDLADANQKNLAELVQTLCGPALKKLGWQPDEQENALTKQLRSMLISALGTIGDDKAVQSRLQQMYQQYRMDKSAVSPDVARAMINVLAHIGDKALYEEFAEQFEQSSTPQEQDRYLSALAGFPDSHLLQETLYKTLNGAIRPSNGPFVVKSVLINKQGRDLAWKFTSRNWKQIWSTFPQDTIVRLCEGITSLTTEEQLAETQEFFAENPVRTGQKTVEQILEKQAIAVAFKKREAMTLQSLE